MKSWTSARASDRVVVVISSCRASGYSPLVIVRWLGKMQFIWPSDWVISNGRSWSSKSS